MELVIWGFLVLLVWLRLNLVLLYIDYSLHSIVSPFLLLDLNYEFKYDMLQVEFGPKYDLCFESIMLCIDLFYVCL